MKEEAKARSIRNTIKEVKKFFNLPFLFIVFTIADMNFTSPIKRSIKPIIPIVSVNLSIFF